MKRLVWTIVVALAIWGQCTMMAQSGPPKQIAEFSGAAFKWVRAAEPEFQKRHLDLNKYIVLVAEQDDSVIVALRSPDATKEARGNTGTLPGYEVEIRKKDLSIVRSNYVR